MIVGFRNIIGMKKGLLSGQVSLIPEFGITGW